MVGVRRVRHQGFSLVEAAFATAVVGTSAVALLGLVANANRSTAENAGRLAAGDLAAAARERTVGMTSAAVVALDGQTFSPPRDAGNTTLAGYAGWSQVYAVQPVDPAKLITNVAVHANNAAWRVTATAQRAGHPSARVQWVVFKEP